jgi:hypothetical protein
MRINPFVFSVLFLLPNLLFGQLLNELIRKQDSIEKILNNIDSEIKELESTKELIRNELNFIIQEKNKLELENEFLEGIPVKINSMGGTLRDQPNINGNILEKIPTDEVILVFNWYVKPYFKASYKEKVGYISYSSLAGNETLKKIVNKEIENENPRLAQLAKKYGTYNAERILNGQYWIGMTPQMVRESIGKPDDVNKSTGAWGINEQWIYWKKELYLYFENGKLTTIQE